MLLWLKLGSALGMRHVAASSFRWGYLVAAVALGAVVGLLGQTLWAVAAARIARLLGGTVRPSDLRLVWGGSALPQVFALILLPLDLTIAGQASYTDAGFADSLSAAWASLSLALCVALALWSLFLFGRGTQVATGMSLARVAGMILLAIPCAAVPIGAAVLAAWAAGGP